MLFDYAMVHVHTRRGVYAAHNDWFWPNSNGNGAADCICGEGCSWDDARSRALLVHRLPAALELHERGRARLLGRQRGRVDQADGRRLGFGVDGFRADAIKHVDISWLTELRAKIKTDVIATQTPAQRFYMVGETYDFGNRDVIKAYVDPAHEARRSVRLPAAREPRRGGASCARRA